MSLLLVPPPTPPLIAPRRELRTARPEKRPRGAGANLHQYLSAKHRSDLTNKHAIVIGNSREFVSFHFFRRLTSKQFPQLTLAEVTSVFVP